MAVEIKTVESRKDLKRFVKLPFRLYKGNEMWVPELIMDDLETFTPSKNPAFEQAEARLFLAFRDGVPAGRVAAILSRIANEKYQTKNMRFGWFECVDDTEVSRALFDAVAAYTGETGMRTITGPLGFTDLDPEGMLIEGFDQFPTIASRYNHPYYQRLLEDWGFSKEIDYLEFRSRVPGRGEFPEKLMRIANRILERSSLRLIEFKNKRALKTRAVELFELLDEAFEEIYGSVPLSLKQKEHYVKKYFTFVNKDMIQAVANDKDQMVGFMITMPSLSRGFQKARGRILPFGWYHILKSMRTHEVVDFYLAGVSKRYRGQGVDLLMVVKLAEVLMNMGFKYAESNLELETNTKVQAQWKYFHPTQHRRRRIFRKEMQ